MRACVLLLLPLLLSVLLYHLDTTAVVDSMEECGGGVGDSPAHLAVAAQHLHQDQGQMYRQRQKPPTSLSQASRCSTAHSAREMMPGFLRPGKSSRGEFSMALVN